VTAIEKEVKMPAVRDIALKGKSRKIKGSPISPPRSIA